ncbi:MAG: PD-(D/E)XK nuclease family protein [Patescibacteria group bacterium]
MDKLSRSKLELFLECPRCFWLEKKHGVKRPSGPPFTLNLAVDYLLKQEFDIHREKGTPHPVMKKHKIQAVPYAHDDINKWRHNFTGIQFHHKPTDFLVFGAVDDIWTNPKGELMVVDYKATGAKEYKIYDSYKRQMEIYQWLLRQNGFNVSPTGYFVFAKANKADGFGMGVAALAFDMFIEPQEGDDSWIETGLKSARQAFDSDAEPKASGSCEYCAYRTAAEDF